MKVFAIILLTLALTGCINEPIAEEYYLADKNIKGGVEPTQVALTVGQKSGYEFTLSWTPSKDPDQNDEDVDDYIMYFANNNIGTFADIADSVWSCAQGTIFIENEDYCADEPCLIITPNKCEKVLAELTLNLEFTNTEDVTYTFGIVGFDGAREGPMSNLIEITPDTSGAGDE